MNDKFFSLDMQMPHICYLIWAPIQIVRIEKDERQPIVAVLKDNLKP